MTAEANDQDLAMAQPSPARELESQVVAPSQVSNPADTSSTEIIESNTASQRVFGASNREVPVHDESVFDSPRTSSAHLDGAEDIAMEDAGYSADEDAEEDSDGEYEPPDATSSAAFRNNDEVEEESATSPSSHRQDLLEAEPVASNTVPLSPNDLGMAEAGQAKEAAQPCAPKSGFVPYETPLRHFHGYRFHPLFKQEVAGGFRSASYSNRIDVKKELCPDELAGHSCPRGNQCEFQHFGTMQAPGECIPLNC